MIEQLPKRFQSKIAVNEAGCWIWTAAKDRHGYGRVSWQGGAKFSHRVVWSLLGTTSAEGLDLDHLCRVTACCNPAHLEPVPHAVNVGRGESADALRAVWAKHTECPYGHPLSGDNLVTNVTRTGYINRTCRQCRSDSAAVNYYKRLDRPIPTRLAERLSHRF